MAAKKEKGAVKKEEERRRFLSEGQTGRAADALIRKANVLRRRKQL